jgi:uncharacterized SAM-binding protein YcdF (DUF218 family)
VVDVLWFLFTFGAAALFILAALIWRRMRPHSAAARRFLVFVAVAYTLASLHPVDRLVVRILSIGLHPLAATDVPSGRTVVVLLGSGSFTARDWAGRKFTIVDAIGATRLLEAARVYQLVAPEWIISSGGFLSTDDVGYSVGDVMRDDLIRLGVPGERILVEGGAKNTREEAVTIERMLRPLHPDHVVLVTSDVHMRRSVGAFRAVGVETIPAIAFDAFSALPWSLWILPSDAGMTEAALVAHELCGIPYYALRGWWR